MFSDKRGREEVKTLEAEWSGEKQQLGMLVKTRILRIRKTIQILKKKIQLPHYSVYLCSKVSPTVFNVASSWIMFRIEVMRLFTILPFNAYLVVLLNYSKQTFVWLWFTCPHWNGSKSQWNWISLPNKGALWGNYNKFHSIDNEVLRTQNM